jgi:hypothetical protein
MGRYLKIKERAKKCIAVHSFDIVSAAPGAPSTCAAGAAAAAWRRSCYFCSR